MPPMNATDRRYPHMSQMNPYESRAEPDPPLTVASLVGETITIDGALTAQEARQGYWMLRSGRIVFWIAVTVIGLASLLMALIIVERLLHGGSWSSLIFPASVIAVLIGILYLPRWRVYRWAATGKGICAPHRRVIDEQGIATETATTNFQQKWTAFYRVRHKEGVLLLYLVEAPKMAMVFGRSMFEDEAQWQQFIDLAETKVNG